MQCNARGLANTTETDLIVNAQRLVQGTDFTGYLALSRRQK